MRFTWDPEKAAKNLRKHGVSFDEAIGIFSDPRHIIMENYLFADDNEQRYQAIGMTDKLVVLSVVFVDRSETEIEVILHIVSARKVNDYEEQLYANASQA